MPTTKSRLNITLSPDLEAAVKRLAERDKISRAGKAAQLLRVGLEIDEDLIWDELARKRDVRGARFMTHKESWA